MRRDPTRLTRREAIGAAAAAALTVSACGPAPPKDRWFVTTLDRVYDEWLEREYVFDPDAGDVGRFQVYIRRDPATGKVVALHPHCGCKPAEGRCPARWTQASKRFICPCHGGVYDENGRIDAAAEEPLAPQPVTVEDGKVYVGLPDRQRR